MTSAFRRYPEGVSSKPGGRLSIASRPGALDDVVLETDEIQGNILGGFNKPFQSILGLKIENPRVFRWRLGELAPRIASATEVLAFNRLYKAIEQRQANGMESRRGNPAQAVRATWVNIAFSYAGLRKLTDGTSLELASPDDFKDEAFRQGLRERSKQLGDPTTGSGSTREWVVGGDDNEADVLIIIASDDRGDLGEEVVWWRTQLEKCATITFPKNLPRYVRDPRMLFHKDSEVEVGAKLPGGKEHFGYRDGISQPGLRGTLSTDPRDVLTPRQNPSNGEQGLPGQDLLWPGEVVFGYPTQVAGGEVTERGPESSAGPEWARNGSFLVFRRLTQDVHAFHSFLESASKNLDLPPEAISDSTDRAAWLSARLVGRWPSGAPVSRTPECDLPDLGENECANNHFAFQTASSAIRLDGMRVGDQPQDTFPLAPMDPHGLRCPFAAHIRKVYPRDDSSPDTVQPTVQGELTARGRLSKADTQTHRLLRRGIPFGKASGPTPVQLRSDDLERGLYFIAYQTSIVRQFEFVTTHWASDPDFREDEAGFDPFIGQNDLSNHRPRTFNIPLANGEQIKLEIDSQWVTPTGGGYFFSPSISAIQRIARATPNPVW